MKNFFLKTNDLKNLLSRNKKTIFFVHGAGAAKLLPQFKKYLSGKSYQIIPTSVEALFVLDEEKILYRVPEDYCDSEEVYSYLKDIETKVMDFALQIDRELEREWPVIAESGLKIAFYNLFPFVRVISPLANVYFKLKKIIEEEKPDRIFVISEEKRSNVQFENMLLWGADEDIFKKVISAYRPNLNVRFVILSNKSPFLKKFFMGWLYRIKGKILKNIRACYFLKLLKRNLGSAILNIFHKFKLAPLLLLNGEYDWRWCQEEFAKRGYYIYGEAYDVLSGRYRKNTGNKKFAESVLLRLEQSPDFREKFKEENIDFYPLIKGKLQIFLEKIVPSCLFEYEKFCQIIKKRHIRALLYSVNPTAISKSIAYAAKRSCVPVVGWQHGDMNYAPTPATTFNDLLSCDLFLSWGKGSDENRNLTAKKIGLSRKTKIVGSASLDKLISAAPVSPEKILRKIGITNNGAQSVIVYATTMYYLSNLYNFSYPPWSDNFLYRTQKKIISRLAQIPGVKIIKLHPSLFYAAVKLDKYCHSFSGQDIRSVRREISAPSLFAASDVVIIDMPSTTLLQAVASGKPVFCLTKYLKLEDEAIRMLKKRAVLSTDSSQLMEEFELFLKTGKYKADLKDKEFLENYGTNSDCRATERAVEAVDRLIKNLKKENV